MRRLFGSPRRQTAIFTGIFVISLVFGLDIVVSESLGDSDSSDTLVVSVATVSATVTTAGFLAWEKFLKDVKLPESTLFVGCLATALASQVADELPYGASALFGGFVIGLSTALIVLLISHQRRHGDGASV